MIGFARPHGFASVQQRIAGTAIGVHMPAQVFDCLLFLASSQSGLQASEIVLEATAFLLALVVSLAGIARQREQKCIILSLQSAGQRCRQIDLVLIIT